MKIKLIRQILCVVSALALLLFCGAAYAENIESGSNYAWGENVGWINLEPDGDGGPGVEVGDSALMGYMWGENIGWISLSCINNDSCQTVNYGVINDSDGNLWGYAWGENVGWIYFPPDDSGVTIDPDTGTFSGYAWGENIGWINFDGVKTSWRGAPDDDEDGYRADVDCDDTDPEINPGAPEVCNGIDDNCNGQIDEGFDADGDGYTTCGGDCDDTNAEVNPEAAEVCNEIDDNCNGNIDEGVCQPPVARCQDVTVQTAPGACTAMASVDAGSSDPGQDPITMTQTPAGPYPLGDTAVTLTVTDDKGESASCTATVTVRDTTPPTITPPANVFLECPADTSPAATGEAVASDDCGAVTITSSDMSVPVCGNTGIITRTWTATDESGNAATALQVITVVDITAPVLSTPADVTIECDAGSSPETTGSATATDTCDTAPTVTYSDSVAAGTCADEMTITRTWTATDKCGNAMSAEQVITVQDTTSPVLSGVPADITVECDSVPDPAAVTATDTCDADVAIALSEVRTDGSCADSYALTRTWTATDDCGNEATASQTITVADTTAPVVTIPVDVTLECPADTSPEATGFATATDTCGDVTVTFEDSVSPGEGNTETITRTWTATDACGNTASAAQTITVQDTTPPTITAPADISVSADPATCAAAEIALGTPEVSDACSDVSFDNNAPDVFPVGITEVTWTATDEAGNSATDVQVVTVTDDEAPAFTAIPADVTVSTDPGSNVATGVDLGSATASDNCTGVTVANDAPVSFPLGATTITWTATDGAGNTATATQVVTVTDTEAPTITNPTGNTTGTTGDAKTISATLGDNVGITAATLHYLPINATVYLVLDFSSGSAAVPVANDAAGEIRYYLVANDTAGNEIREPLTGTFTITITDDEPPVASADTYSVDEDTTLNIGAPGILGNDTDNIIGVPLTSELVEGVNRGTLTLSSNGSFTYAPAANVHGTDSFTYKASDGVNQSETATVTITVNAVNDAPQLDAIGNQTVDEAKELSFTVTAHDIENDPLSFSASVLPEGAALDPETGAFSWTPTYAQAGTCELTFSVSDGTLSDTETITITIVNVNRSPVAEAGPDQILEATAPQGAEVALDGSGSSDPDAEDELSYAWTWEGGSASGVSPVVTLPIGVTVVSLVVSDGSLSSEDSLSVTVLGAKSMKGTVITELEGATTGNRKVDRVITRITKFITRSLKHTYWDDELHLRDKHGRKVFTYEGLAVADMKLHIRFWNRRGPTPEQAQAIEAFEAAIPKLVEVDQLLAERAIAEAKELSPPSKRGRRRAFERFLERADKAFDRALAYQDDGRPALAIEFFKHAWNYARLAKKLAG